MTAAHTTTDAARSYLDRVRDLLSDLPEEERAELIQDLATHLEELGAGEIEVEMGTPEAFVAEFRAMAGLDQRSGHGPGTFARIGGLLRSWQDHPAVISVIDRWPAVRPVWVGVRGWLLVALVAVIGAAGTAFRAFPIPEIEHSTAAGLIAVAVATGVSFVLAQRVSAHRGWSRLGNVAFNAVVLWLTVLGLFNGNLYTVRGLHDETLAADQGVRDELNMLLPRDLVATTPTGDRLERVLLYDQEGRPFDLSRVRWQLGLDWPYDGAPGAEPDDSNPLNAYPIAGTAVVGEGIEAEVPMPIEVPDLTGAGVGEAGSVIESLGLTRLVATERIEVQDANLWERVVDQVPDPGTTLGPGDAVTLILGGEPATTTTSSD